MEVLQKKMRFCSDQKNSNPQPKRFTIPKQYEAMLRTNEKIKSNR